MKVDVLIRSKCKNKDVNKYKVKYCFICLNFYI